MYFMYFMYFADSILTFDLEFRWRDSLTNFTSIFRHYDFISSVNNVIRNSHFMKLILMLLVHGASKCYTKKTGMVAHTFFIVSLFAERLNVLIGSTRKQPIMFICSLSNRLADLSTWTRPMWHHIAADI